MIATHVSVPKSGADQPKKKNRERTVKFHRSPVLAGKVVSSRFFSLYENTREGSHLSLVQFLIVRCASASASPIRIGNSVSHSFDLVFNCFFFFPLFLDLSQSRKLQHSNSNHQTIPLTTLTLLFAYPSILS